MGIEYGQSDDQISPEKLPVDLQSRLHAVYGPFESTLLPHSGTQIITYGDSHERDNLSLIFPTICLNKIIPSPNHIQALQSKGTVAQVEYPHDDFDGVQFVTDVITWMQHSGYSSFELEGVSFGARQLAEIISFQQQNGVKLPISKYRFLAPVMRFDHDHIDNERMVHILSLRSDKLTKRFAKDMHHDPSMMEVFEPYWDELFFPQGYLARVNYLLDTDYPHDLEAIEADIETAYWEEDVITGHAKAEMDILIRPSYGYTTTKLSRLPGMHGQLWTASPTLHSELS